MFFDGGQSPEQEAVDVGEGGGAAGGDAALLEGEREVPEKSVDVGGGFSLREGLAEEGGKVGGVVEGVRCRRGCKTRGAGVFAEFRAGLLQVMSAEGLVLGRERDVAAVAGFGDVLAHVARMVEQRGEVILRDNIVGELGGHGGAFLARRAQVGCKRLMRLEIVQSLERRNFGRAGVPPTLGVSWIVLNLKEIEGIFADRFDLIGVRGKERNEEGR